MVEALHYAFLDESGGVAIFTPGERFLIVAVLVTRKPRSLELAIKRALRRFGTSLASGEVKAAHSTDRVIRWVLESIAWQDVQIVAVAVDKQSIVKPLKDPEDLYRMAVAKAIQRCVERWPRLEITLDRRYTHEHLRHKLEWCIREKIADLEGQAVVIRQMDSVRVKALQAVDFVAWALWQKYQWEDESYHRIVKDRIVVEEIAEAK